MAEKLGELIHEEDFQVRPPSILRRGVKKNNTITIIEEHFTDLHYLPLLMAIATLPGWDMDLSLACISALPLRLGALPPVSWT
jgi:hypothetical protein